MTCRTCRINCTKFSSRFSHHRTDAVEATQKWNNIVERIAECKLGFMPMRILLQEINAPPCYEDNAEYLKDDEPHAVYPTSIYRTSHSYVLAKPDASVIEGIMGLTLTTSIKIVYGLLNPENHELKKIYQPFGRYVNRSFKTISKASVLIGAIICLMNATFLVLRILFMMLASQ